ncbi:MAG: M23 family metallopeptidase [Bacteroidota bacterium]
MHAQYSSPDYFRSPLDQPLRLSGTFAEFRNDHLHSGIDIPANQGSRVMAIADGYVARIRLQLAGFGYVIYVNHDNGYTSVYAHLSSFSPELQKYFRGKQISEETFELDYSPEPGSLPVKKGQLIAFSGNTGASQGPHLHFEIRGTAEEAPTNPLLLGIKVIDPIRPVFKILRLYSADPEGHFLSSMAPKDIPVVGSSKGFRLKTSGVLKVPAFVVFGLQANDIGGGGGRNGLYSVVVKLDNVTKYYSGMDFFTFDEFRSVNSLIDFPFYQRSKRFVQLTRVAACNNLAVFKDTKRDAVFDFSDCKKHIVSIDIKDIQGNTASLEFEAICDNPPLMVYPAIQYTGSVQTFPCDQPNFFAKSDVRFFMPKGVLFDTLHMEYKKYRNGKSKYSAVHEIHNTYTPLNNFCVISIKPDSLPQALRDKACLARVEGNGMSCIGGGFENGWVSASTRKFGSFTVYVDQTPPTISLVGISKKKKGKKKAVAPVTGGLRFKISDNFSGIGTYCAYVNNKFVLMEFNNKNNQLFYKYDENLLAGKNNFELVVTDKKGNESRFQTIIVR